MAPHPLDQFGINPEALLASTMSTATFSLPKSKCSSPCLKSSQFKVRALNDTSNKLILAWVDFKGRFVPSAVVEPSEPVELQSYPGHQWVVFEMNQGNTQISAAVVFDTGGYIQLSQVLSKFKEALQASSTASNEENATITNMYPETLNLGMEYCEAIKENQVIGFNIHDCNRMVVSKWREVEEPYIESLKRLTKSMSSNIKMVELFAQKAEKIQDSEDGGGDAVSVKLSDPIEMEKEKKKMKVVSSYKNQADQSSYFMSEWIRTLSHWSFQENVLGLGFKHETVFLFLPAHLVFIALLWVCAALQSNTVASPEARAPNAGINNNLVNTLIVQIVQAFIAGPMAIYGLRPIHPTGKRMKREAWKQWFLVGEISLKWQKIVFRVTVFVWFLAFVGLAAQAHCTAITGIQSAALSCQTQSSSPPTCSPFELAMCCDDATKAKDLATSCSSSSSVQPSAVCEKDTKMTCVLAWILPAVAAILESIVAIFLLVWWRPNLPSLKRTIRRPNETIRPSLAPEIRLPNEVGKKVFHAWSVVIHGHGPMFPIRVTLPKDAAYNAHKNFMGLREQVILSQAKEHCRHCSHKSGGLFSGTCKHKAEGPNKDLIPPRGRGSWKKSWAFKWKFGLNEA